MNAGELALGAAIAVGMVVIVSLVAWAVRCERRRADRTRESWRSLAEELGGRFVPPSGPWYRRRSTRVEAEILDVLVELDNYTVSTGQTTQTFTRAATKGPRNRRFRMGRRRALSGIGRALGAQDVELGDRAYDDAFVVKTDDPSWLRNRITPLVRELHLRQPRVSLSLKGGRVTGVVTGWRRDTEELRGLMELVAATGTALA